MAPVRIACVALILTIVQLLLLFVDPANPASTVYYPDFGKFSHWDFFHWKYRPIVLLPEDPKKLQVEFLLFTRQNPYDPERYTYRDGIDPYRGTNFDPRQETKVIIHGKMVSPHRDPWIFRMKDAWLQAANYNVVVMDWSRAANTAFTPRAVANARVCGPMLGMFLVNLCAVFQLDPGSVHLVGHGQGAHIAGIAGKWVGPGRVGQITALDPSGPFYQGLQDKRSGLWNTDAQFVEAIHTSGSEISSYWRSGMHETCAHVDIFPNGGEHQPGCTVKRRASYLLRKSYLEPFSCSHYRSVEFYLETINPVPGYSTPVAYACETYQLFLDGQCHTCGKDGADCAILGPLNRLYTLGGGHKRLESSEGKRFYMVTDDQHHYFKYQYLVIIKMAPSNQYHEVRKGKLSLRFWSIQSVRSKLKAEADIDHKKWKKKNKKEKHGKKMIDFYEKPEKFYYGHSYRQVLLSDVDPEYLGAIELRWKTDKKKKEKDTIYIEHVDVVPLSFKSPLLPPKDSNVFLRFSKDGNRIPNRETVMLARVEIRVNSTLGQQSLGNHSISDDGKFEAEKSSSSKVVVAQRADYNNNNPGGSYEILWI